jgi:hypothetical protein
VIDDGGRLVSLHGVAAHRQLNLLRHHESVRGHHQSGLRGHGQAALHVHHLLDLSVRLLGLRLRCPRLSTQLLARVSHTIIFLEHVL